MCLKFSVFIFYFYYYCREESHINSITQSSPGRRSFFLLLRAPLHTQCTGLTCRPFRKAFRKTKRFPLFCPPLAYNSVQMVLPAKTQCNFITRADHSLSADNEVERIINALVTSPGLVTFDLGKNLTTNTVRLKKLSNVCA